MPVTVRQQARKRAPATVELMGEVSIVGQNVKLLREARDWSQEYLAEKSGVHRVTIAKLETGGQEGVSTANLGALADALGVTTDSLREPMGTSPIAHLVPQLEASGLLAPPLTDEERKWLLRLPAVVWKGMSPNVATLYKMVDALRSGPPRDEEEPAS